MLFNLLLLPALSIKPDKAAPPPKQPESKLNEQIHSSSLRHHLDAIESLRQFHQRYYLDRRLF
ncbi:MAG: hypothetical protein QNJ46_19205 [Leptolyngbyaceae cyanobacterium MO_188.B28]|nr:hypothetical protein [Leptolyngbyaceae cyanobacterium MO_188.B28]